MKMFQNKLKRNFIYLILYDILSQPTLRREGDASASPMGGKCTESPPTFIQGKRRKNRKRCGLRTLIVKGSGVVFTHGEGISTPRVRHKGQQPLTKCAISCLQVVLFSLFYIFMSFYAFCIFLSFCGQQGYFPCSYVFLNCDEEIRPT